MLDKNRFLIEAVLSQELYNTLWLEKKKFKYLDNSNVLFSCWIF